MYLTLKLTLFLMRSGVGMLSGPGTGFRASFLQSRDFPQGRWSQKVQYSVEHVQNASEKSLQFAMVRMEKEDESAIFGD